MNGPEFGGASRVTRAAICLQRHARRQPGSQAVPVGHGLASQRQTGGLSRRRAAICLQRHARRLASRSDRPFVLLLRRLTLLAALTPLAWLACFLAFSNMVPNFLAVATAGCPLIMTVALSIMAHLQLGPAWCRGAFLAKLSLRASALLHPLVFLTDLHQATTWLEGNAENAIFFLQVGTGLGVAAGTLSGVLPASPGTRYFYIGLNSACLAGKYLYIMWDHVDCGAVVLLAPPLLCALCGHLSHITVSATLLHTAAREEAMGDLRRMLDGKTVVKDTAAATREWVRGPQTEIYKGAVLAGLVFHACDIATACWAHGCYAVDEPSVRCVRYVFAMLALVAIWSLLTYQPLDIDACHDLCGTVALAHTLYAVAYIAGALLDETSVSAAD